MAIHDFGTAISFSMLSHRPSSITIAASQNVSAVPAKETRKPISGAYKMKLRALLAALALVASQAADAAYDKFYVFGDSLSDTGNAATLSGGAFPGTPSGTASTGPVAADYMANYFGVSGYGPSAAGGSNFAVIGATTGTKNFNYEINDPAGVNGIPGLASSGMTSQLAAFITAAPTFDPNSTLFMVWGGPNDLFLGQALGEDPATVTVPTAVNNLATIVGGLAAAGAKTVLVPLMPDLGVTPLGLASGNALLFSQITAGFNNALTGAMAQVEQLTGVNVIIADTSAYLAQVLANPATFGFTNTTDQCLDSAQALATGCKGYLFFDEVHPTTEAHRILAGGFISLVPEPGTAWLLVPLVLAAGASRRLRMARR